MRLFVLALSIATVAPGVAVSCKYKDEDVFRWVVINPPKPGLPGFEMVWKHRNAPAHIMQINEGDAGSAYQKRPDSNTVEKTFTLISNARTSNQISTDIVYHDHNVGLVDLVDVQIIQVMQRAHSLFHLIVVQLYTWQNQTRDAICPRCSHCGPIQPMLHSAKHYKLMR